MRTFGAAFVVLMASILVGTLVPAKSEASVRLVAPHGATLPLSGGHAAGAVEDEGCVNCHEGIEDMHPGFPLSCVDCHGGDGSATAKGRAHVASTVTDRADERVAPLDQDLAYVRFVNPMDLRVAEATCGECHGDLVQHLMVSLHGTTAGHLSDGFFETGMQEERDSRYSVFPVTPLRGSEDNVVDRLQQPPKIDGQADRMSLAAHFPDLIRKECMQCHLWSQGRAVRGRIGFDGEYRGGGCAACHVVYGTDGISESADRHADRFEPGHPLRHQLVGAPPTETCTTCHYGDASIGLHFRGLSQLAPGAAGGPEVPGTTDSLLHRSFFVNDPAVTPPDVHHASGMHCVDCHTLGGVMGDGRLTSKMEDATEISCEACHGTFEAKTDRTTERGNELKHLFERDGSIWLKSKVDGEEHRIKQAVDVVTPDHADFNAEAARAMNGAHGDVACYTCHAGWNVNFLGFHFYRNEALTQLDLLTGKRTKGRVTTQEKVFTTWKGFYAGRDDEGRVAPYLTGFSTMGTVDDEDGVRLLDQELPVTANGLSGLTMIHHQLHSTRPTARSCVECHRASETWGMGSQNFRLGRQLVFTADRRGIDVVVFDRENPQSSVPLAKFVLPDVIDLEVQCDPLQGHAQYVYATEGRRGVHVLDVSDPREPKRAAFHMSVSPRGLALSGNHLYVADGVGGLKIFDVSKPGEIRRVATVPTVDAYEVEVRWPYAYVADGPGGLVVVDVRYPVAPKVVGGLGLGAFSPSSGGSGAIDLDVTFQYSRPMVDRDGKPSKERTPARRVVVVCDEESGPVLVDATEPRYLAAIPPSKKGRNEADVRRNNARYTGVAIRSHVDVASPQGGTPTVERDLLYFIEERPVNNGALTSFLRVVDISDPAGRKQIGVSRLGDEAEMLVLATWYNAPFLRPLAFVPGEDGLVVGDVSNSAEVTSLGSIVGLRDTYVIAAEEFPLDAMVNEDHGPLKDVSHPRSRWFLRGEIERTLDVSPEALGTIGPYAQESIAAASGARALFQRADSDGSGLLTGDERRIVGGPGVDADGDGRVTLYEVSLLGDEAQGRTVAVEVDAPEPPEARVGPDGDIARLFDGIDPFDFDKNRDVRLDRKEARRAMLAALDLDGDGRLNIHELSRHPGSLRELRFGDRASIQAMKSIDKTGGGTIGPREFVLGDEEWSLMDADRDGFVQLDPASRAARRGRFDIPPEVEWPTRRRFGALALPPGTRTDALLATFDANGDGQLSKRELKKRPDLFVQLDRNGTTVVEEDEVSRAEAILLRRGLELVPDGFVERWDFDGSGKVEDEELPELVRTLLRRRIR